MTTTASHRRALVALLLVAVFVGAACSTTSETSEGVASLDAGGDGLETAADAATLDDNDPAADLPPDEAALAFSACMRDEGLDDFPDLGIDAAGNIELREAFQAVDRQADGFQAAMETCQPFLASGGFGGGQGRRGAIEAPEVQDALVAFSACLRDAGYDVGDLTLDGGPGQGPGAGGDGEGQGEGADQGQGQRGERQAGFGNRSARFAENLGLDYTDEAVAADVDACMPIVDDAFAAAGVGQPAGTQG
ncbi:MAG: hypothetical protein AAF467_09260 [Actinomycetota bacterium]